MNSIFYTDFFRQLLLNWKWGSDQSTRSIFSYIIGKKILMHIEILSALLMVESSMQTEINHPTHSTYTHDVRFVSLLE